MKVLKMLQLDKDDTQDSSDMRTVEEYCNMAAAFFYEDRLGREKQDRGEGLRAIRVFTGGHPFEFRHIQAAIDEVDAAMSRIKRTESNQFLAEETKDQYMANLSEVSRILLRWKEAVI